LGPVASPTNLIVMEADRGAHPECSREGKSLTVHPLLLLSIWNIAFHVNPGGNHVGHLLSGLIKSLSAVVPDVPNNEIDKVFPMTTQVHQFYTYKS